MKTFILFVFSNLILHFATAQQKELTIKGVYHGTNLYVQNAHLDDGSYCIKEIFVNGKPTSFPASTAFDIDLSVLKINQNVEVRIMHNDQCTPKILNSQAIRSRLPFRFASIKVDMNGMYWITKGEKKFGQFFIQIKNNRTWIVEKVISCKGNTDRNVYTLPVAHRGGENIYRIKYLDVTGKYFYSPEIKFLAEGQQKVTFYPKSVTNRITFSRETTYQILDNNGKLIKEGAGLTVDCSNLRMGAYYLYFDDQEARFFKK